MGIYDYLTSSSPFDADVEKATNENNTAEEWGRIMEICDKVGSSEANARDCLRSIVKRLHNQDPHVVLQAITLLDACVNNCGKTFQLEVASREFESELKKILKKWSGITKVGSKIRTLLKSWSEADFKSDPQLSLMTSFYMRFKVEGIDVTIQPEPSAKSKTQRTGDPDCVSSQQEVDDIAKAIELSLKESGQTKMSASQEPQTSSLYPSVSGGVTSSNSQSHETRKVRALYDFEAAEDNELTFFAGEIIHVLDDSDVNWWKGCNQRGEGLFPANFVTSDLSAEPEKLKSEKKGVQFNESVEVKTIKTIKKVEIDEAKIDRVLHLLHEADPNGDSSGDPEELESLEDEVTEMGPLIDAELERVDRNHAQLTQTCAGLVEALNLYHALMRDVTPKPGLPPPNMAYMAQPPVPQPMYHPTPPMPHQDFIYQNPPQPHFNGPFPPPPGPHYPPAPPNN
ncbi:hypothetical protein O3M35_005329 [Rhynocoris fuscipes]|uniref:Signal transducing adapter molecule 1 n=1 Tax=Rhynocoris fuscipes TaxID=488301 RepID=A0AAW1DNS4_9HEMI